jgi:hypothetical protein
MLNIKIPPQFKNIMEENQGIVTIYTDSNVYVEFETK